MERQALAAALAATTAFATITASAATAAATTHPALTTTTAFAAALQPSARPSRSLHALRAQFRPVLGGLFLAQPLRPQVLPTV